MIIDEGKKIRCPKCNGGEFKLVRFLGESYGTPQCLKCKTYIQPKENWEYPESHTQQASHPPRGKGIGYEKDTEL